MEKLANTFLFRLYATDKKLFAVVAFFILGTFYCVINCNTFLFSKRCEEFPFLLFGMYSLREEPKETYSSHIIAINKTIIESSPLNNSRFELIYSPVQHIDAMNISEEEKQKMWKRLEPWLERYFDKSDSAPVQIFVFKNEYDSTDWKEPFDTYIQFTNDYSFR